MKEDPPKLFDTWWCPKCTWFRDLTRDVSRQTAVHYHPVYGEVSAYVAWKMDISRHSCKETLASRRRHGFLIGSRIEPYIKLNEREYARRGNS